MTISMSLGRGLFVKYTPIPKTQEGILRWPHGDHRRPDIYQAGQMRIVILGNISQIKQEYNQITI